MSNSWLRLWHDMPNDPKWRTVSRVSKQPVSVVIGVYLHILVNASNASERGRTQNLCSEDIASALDVETEQVDAILSAMQGRVLDGDEVSGWKKRQPAREDGSSERSKQWREAKKAQRLDDSNAVRTQANAKKRPDTDTDTDTEEAKAQAACASDEHPPAAQSEPKTTEAARACKLMRQAGCTRVNPLHPDLLAAIDELVTPEELGATAGEAVDAGKSNPFAYAIATARSRRAQGAKTIPIGATHAASTSGRSLSAADRVLQQIANRRESEQQLAGTCIAIGDRPLLGSDVAHVRA